MQLNEIIVKKYPLDGRQIAPNEVCYAISYLKTANSMPQFFLRLYKAFLYSWNGLRNAWSTQWAFRVEILGSLIALPCAFYIGKNAIEYVLLLSSLCLLLIVEIVNSAIETTVNRIGLELHELSGLAKDLASAAVLLAIINLAVTWGIILFL